MRVSICKLNYYWYYWLVLESVQDLDSRKWFVMKYVQIKQSRSKEIPFKFVLLHVQFKSVVCRIQICIIDLNLQ